MSTNTTIPAVAVMLLLAAGPGVRAQSPAQDERSAVPTDTSGEGTMVHVEGCLYPERALSSPGPVIVPIGSAEDYVLTDTRLVAGTGGEAELSEPMYALEEVTADRLRVLGGKKVGVTGRVNDEPETPALRVVSIREISGVCPSVPGPRS